MRSWFFRVFSVMALFLITLMNLILYFSPNNSLWTNRAIAANLPYLNIVIINTAQAIIAIFLASDFLRRDRKMDTTETIYSRPISNSEYVAGKTAGIFAIFIWLVIAVLIITFIFNYILKDTPVVWQAYLLYPLLLTIPTIIFILGLSFLAMILIRNQSVTFILLLGYIGLTLFYLKDKLFGLFDYMAFDLSLVYSDIIGFAGREIIICQRLTYFFLGLAFIYATIIRLNRLPNGKRLNFMNVSVFLIFTLAGSFSGYRYYSLNDRIFKNRDYYKTINEKLSGENFPDIISDSITVKHMGKELDIVSEITLISRSESPEDTINISLNPGFRVQQIVSNDKPVDFLREGHVIRIIPLLPLMPADSLKYRISYSGSPVTDICYLDIRDENILAKRRISMLNIGKTYGIVSDDYVLLTPEMLWYPVGGITYNQKTLLPRKPDFTSFRLNVTSEKGMSVFSQGQKTISDEGDFIFHPENDLNGISLVIGRYEEMKTKIDSITLTIAFLPGHDFFSSHFKLISDTIPDLLREYKNQYEVVNVHLKYPFNRINLIEVPIQFHAYERSMSQAPEFVQPEIFFMPEKGCGLTTVDFAKFQYNENRNNRRGNQVRTPEEIERDFFRRFVNQTFFSSGVSMLLNTRGTAFSRNPYSAFPQYYSFKTGFVSEKIPIFNSMVESYLNSASSVTGVPGLGMPQGMTGITDIERANLTLRDFSLNEVVNSWRSNLAPAIISQKGHFLMTSLKNKAGITEFNEFIYRYIDDHSFSLIELENFRKDFIARFNIDINQYLESINTNGKIPGFIFSDIIYHRTRDDFGPVYVVRFSVTNTGKVKGLLDITFESGGRGGFGGGGFGGGGNEPEERIVEVDSSVTKDIQFVLYDQPRFMMINTIISENVPANIRQFLRQPASGSVEAVAFDRVLEKPVQKAFENEIIVDNEDPGFSNISDFNETKIKKYIESRRKTDEKTSYSGGGTMRTPKKWTRVTGSGLYGSIRLSALVTAGSKTGGQKAVWKAMIPSSSLYNIYVYLPVSIMRDPFNNRFNRGQGGSEENSGEGGQQRQGTAGGRPAGNRQGGPGGPGARGPGMQGFTEAGSEYNYSVISGNGREDIEFTLTDVSDGWNKIGSFDLPADTVTIELSNKSSGKRIVADAVKFVRITD